MISRITIWPVWPFHQALALAGAGEVRQDIDAVRRQIAGGQNILPAGLRHQAAQVAKPADARYSQRRMADCWPGSWRQGCARTRGRAVSGYLLAVTRTRVAGRRSGPDTVRARGGPAGEDRAPGDVLLRAARDPGGQDHDRRAGQREERRVRAVPLISHGTRRSAGPVDGGGRVRDRQQVRISAGAARGTPEHQRRERQNDERPDQRAYHTAPVEDAGVADAKANGEDEVADQGPGQAEHERNQPRPRSPHLPEGIVRNEHAGHDSAEQAEKERSDHHYPRVNQLYAVIRRLRRTAM